MGTWGVGMGTGKGTGKPMRMSFSKLLFSFSPILGSGFTLRFALKTPESLKGAEKKRTLQKHPLDNRFSA